ncbi:MAG TPA: ABC transporter permease [Gemmatimonadaceae bacterium]
MKRAQWAAITLVIALIGGAALLLAATGHDVGRAVAALFSGSVGSWNAIASGTLIRATPLMLTGLAVAIAFRAGVFNIGAEGQFNLGAAAAAATALSLGAVPRGVLVLVVLIVGAVAGAAWASIAAVLRARFRVLEVISTIMLNFVALYLISYLVRGPLQEPTHVYPQTSSLALNAQLPRLGPATRLHLGFIVAVAACLVGAWVIRNTAGGFRLRAVGANPHAARSAGMISPERVTMLAFLTSGALAGLAGAIEVSGVTYALYENISPGYGYTAIAVALLARLDAAAIIATGFVFGALEAGGAAMQRDAGVPSVVVSVVEAGIILALIAAGRTRILPSFERR